MKRTLIRAYHWGEEVNVVWLSLHGGDRVRDKYSALIIVCIRQLLALCGSRHSESRHHVPTSLAGKS